MRRAAVVIVVGLLAAARAAAADPAGASSDLTVEKKAHVVVVEDHGAGFAIDFPSAPTIEDSPYPAADGPRPGAMASLEQGAGGFVFGFTRLQPSDYDHHDVRKSASAGIAANVAKGMKLVESRAVTLAGLAGQSYTGQQTVEGHALVFHGWVLIDPKHDTLYQIIVITEDGPVHDPAATRFAGTFRRAAR